MRPIDPSSHAQPLQPVSSPQEAKQNSPLQEAREKAFEGEHEVSSQTTAIKVSVWNKGMGSAKLNTLATYNALKQGFKTS